MQIVLHWDHLRTNFVNQELGNSSKNKVGHKPSRMQLTTTILVDRDRLDVKFKNLLYKELCKHKNAIHKDMRVNVFIGGKLFIFSARDFRKLSNNITNGLIIHRRMTDKDAFNKIEDKFKKIVS